MALPIKAVSAPGKVLLAGGYLVLDRNYTGLVFGLDARIHVVIQPLSTTTSGVSLQEIIVKSPQFKDAVWQYGYRQSPADGGVDVTQLDPTRAGSLNRNAFVETTLTYALSYITALTHSPIAPSSISILADNSYYSNPPAVSPHPSSRFANFAVPLSAAHKTGLGSSAALVTSLSAALLAHYLPASSFDLRTAQSRTQLHNLAQAAHCAAQGKVGSGFDVASAVHGSALYRRFSPSLLASIPTPGAKGFATHLVGLTQESTVKWDTQIEKDRVSIPAGLRLVMADVDCGSQTPGMVKQVLAWRAANSDAAGQIWDALQAANEGLGVELVRLAGAETSDYGVLRSKILDIRALLRAMTEAAGVPIEPAEQTDLLDALGGVEGVVGGVVPGAGGYDAVAVLIEDKPEVVERLASFVEGYKGKEGATIGRVGMLGVKGEMEGVREEGIGEYQGWVA